MFMTEAPRRGCRNDYLRSKNFSKYRVEKNKKFANSKTELVDSYQSAVCTKKIKIFSLTMAFKDPFLHVYLFCQVMIQQTSSQ